MLFVWDRGPWPRIDRLEAHLRHQACHALAIDRETMMVIESGRHLAVAIERRLSVLLINQPHELQVERAIHWPETNSRWIGSGRSARTGGGC